jgi:glycerol-3-phosphate acyltransferase PlsY
LLGASVLTEGKSAISVYACLFLLAFVFDFVRIKSARFNHWVLCHFGNLLRAEERESFTAMPYFTLGVFLTTLFYEPPVAKASLIFLVFGDVSATFFGQKFGGIKIGRKTLEGSIAFVAAGIAAGTILSMLHRLPFGVIAIGAFAGALVELFSSALNDNLTIPVVTGGVMTLLL